MAHLEDIDNTAPADSLYEGSVKINLMRARIDTLNDALGDITAAEANQLENIAATTITAAQWVYVSELDQSLITSSNVQFAQLNIAGNYTFPTVDGSADQVIKTDGSGTLSWTTGAGAGDITGPEISTDHAIPRWHETAGDELLDSGITIDDSNVLTIGSGHTLDVSAGTLTLAANQISGDKVEGGTVAAITITSLTAGTYTLPSTDGTLDQMLKTDGSNTLSWTTIAAGGDVSAAAVMTDHAIVRGDGGAKGVQDSGITIDDNDNVLLPGNLTISASHSILMPDNQATALKIATAETFGSTDKGGTEAQISGDRIWACKYESGSAGSLASISVYIKDATGDTKVKCAICDSSYNILTNGTTEEKTTPASQDGWMTFNFSTAPTVTASTNYYLAFWIDGALYIYYAAGTTDQTRVDIEVYNSWPDPLVPTDAQDWAMSVYATYTDGTLTSYLTFVSTNGAEKITLGKKLEAGAVEIEGSAFDINGGTIDNTVVGNGNPSTGSFTTLSLRSVGELRFYNDGNYVGFEAPALDANQIWVLPSADGAANQVMETDGSGTLSWVSAPGADTSLSNLASVSINTSLISDTDNTDDLGSATKEWKDLYIDGTANIDALVADTADIDGGTIGGVTLDGAIAGGDQAFTNVGDMTFAAGSILKSGSTNTNTLLLAANDTTFITLTTGDTDTCAISGAAIDNCIIGAGTAVALTCTTFTSTGIDDNADATALTISVDEVVSLGAAKLTVGATTPTAAQWGYLGACGAGGGQLLAALTTGESDQLELIGETTISAAQWGYLGGCSGIIANVVEDTSPQLGGELDCQAHTIGFTQQVVAGDGTTTIDWKLGNKVYFTFGGQADTFTFTQPTHECNLLLVLKQDGTGSRLATWPGTVLWPGGVAPTLSTGANAVDVVSFYWNGSSYHGVANLAFATP